MSNIKREKLVVIGNGIAGNSTVEQIIKLGGNFDITVIGQEPHLNYNRIMLSYVLEGSKTLDDIVLNDWKWYEDNHITLHTGVTVTAIDGEHKVVTADNGLTVPYDKVMIATGSKPFILHVPGSDKEGVIGFRNIADCNQMLEAAKAYKKAAVIGGDFWVWKLPRDWSASAWR